MKLTLWKENDGIKIYVPGNEVSRAGLSLAFDAIKKEMDNNIKHKNLKSKPKGQLSIIATFPNDEPWITTAKIISEGFSFDEIWEIIIEINRKYYESFNPIDL
ncbi:MAG: hypothetical protein ACM3RX_10675 [Methanococcaceae archaeon]